MHVNWYTSNILKKIEKLKNFFSKIDKGDMTSVNSIKFSKPKQSGNFEKINITDSNGEKVTIETENCFSWGVQKSNRYESYSLLWQAIPDKSVSRWIDHYF